MIKKVRETFVRLTLQFQKLEDGTWLAECKELGTVTQSGSLESAQEELLELVELHLNGLEDAGERERFFEEHNIIVYDFEPPKKLTIEAPSDIHIFSQPYIKSLAGAN